MHIWKKIRGCLKMTPAEAIKLRLPLEILDRLWSCLIKAEQTINQTDFQYAVKELGTLKW